MSLVHIQVRTSTKKYPFRFFTEISHVNPLLSAIESFKNQIPNKSLTSFNKFPLKKVSKNNLTFVVEINVGNAGYADEFGNWVTSPSEKWITKTYTFKEELYKLLRREYHNSLNYLREKFEQDGFSKNTSSWFKRNLDELVNCLKIIEQKKELKGYIPEFIKPYEELIRHLYLKYKTFLPKIYPDKRIGEILTSSADSAPLYMPYKIRASLYKGIVNLEDKYGNSFFGFEDPIVTEENFKLFAAKRMNEITTSINFTKKIKAAYYLFREIRHLINMDVAEIINANILYFSGKPFNRSSYDTNASRISVSDKLIIDKLLSDNLF